MGDNNDQPHKRKRSEEDLEAIIATQQETIKQLTRENKELTTANEQLTNEINQLKSKFQKDLETEANDEHARKDMVIQAKEQWTRQIAHAVRSEENLNIIKEHILDKVKYTQLKDHSSPEFDQYRRFKYTGVLEIGELAFNFLLSVDSTGSDVRLTMESITNGVDFKYEYEGSQCFPKASIDAMRKKLGLKDYEEEIPDYVMLYTIFITLPSSETIEVGEYLEDLLIYEDEKQVTENTCTKLSKGKYKDSYFQ